MGRRTSSILRRLGRFESRNVTFVDPDGTWPIVWQRARGVHVWDVEGRRYLDLTAAFGVAAAGHANPAVVSAGQRQMGQLLHAMGDVHPHELKARLAEELSRLTFGRWKTRRGVRQGKVIFANSGFEAVEAALKTARLATGRRGVLAFQGAYHGLGYGALNATHRDHFRSPFRNQLGGFARFVPFPMEPAESSAALRAVEKHLERGKTGAVLLEPVQARGGVRVPPPGFLSELRQRCDQAGALLIVDEIYTGFGRTGRWFAIEHEQVVPDLICLGKALTGGFPLSACVGRADLMDAAWPASQGEAIHTSTFLGHPVGCAMALAQIAEIKRLSLVPQAARMGRWLRIQLASLAALGPSTSRWSVRGIGLLAGLACHRADGRPDGARVVALTKSLLQRGFILLPEGPDAEVLSLTPPLLINEKLLRPALRALAEELGRPEWKPTPTEEAP